MDSQLEILCTESKKSCTIVAVKLIESSQNKLYKELKKLATNNAARVKAGKIVLEGAHVCQMFLQHKDAPEYCIVTDISLTDKEVANIVQDCQDKGARVLNVPDHLFRGLSSVDTGVSVLFFAAVPVQSTPAAISTSAVLIDRLQDPGNLGTILRSAAAAGITEVYCSGQTVAAWSPKVVRSAMGAHFALNIYEHQDLSAVIRDSKTPVVATSSYAPESIYESDLSGDIAWLVGHEGQGVSDALLKLCNITVSIPHKGNIESLNVAVATSICLFEQLRQSSY